MSRLLLCLAFLFPFSASAQQKNDPPKSNPPDEKQVSAIQVKQEQLRKRLSGLKDNPALPSVEIYLKASERIVEFNEFWHADSVKWTLAILDQGLKRADDLSDGKSPWLVPSTKSTSRAYRSRIDGSVQPYAITFPADYGKDPGRKYRLDLVLHGRDATLTEVKFLNAHNGTKDAPKDRDFVQIDIFGRGNNAYRWAGEEDVFEALQHVLDTEISGGRGGLIDPQRIVLRGFSMGGAGTWHLGLHHPSRFCVIGPGAGFTTTHGYVKGLTDPLPSPQEETLRIYDAVRYAENASGLPIVAYSGDKDPQKAAADNVEKRLKELNIATMTHLIAPGLEHQFPAEWQKKAEAEFAKYATKGRDPTPDEVRFSTHTLKYAVRDWVELRGLEIHYEFAQIEAVKKSGGVEIRTKNVREFALREAESSRFKGVMIDGKEVVRPDGKNRHFAKKNGVWVASESESPRLQKRPGLQGPIDDALTNQFVVIESRKPFYHREIADAVGHQFTSTWEEWRRYFRGDFPVKADHNLTESDIRDSNLILWGDPKSLPLLAEMMPKLPFKWTAEFVEFGGEKYDAKTHYVSLIYPNPMNPKRYVVLNSGHTFHEADLKGTNALLYPRLGDYAVIKLAPTDKDRHRTELVRSGLFNEFWELAPARK